jgi:hypothetical protein
MEYLLNLGLALLGGFVRFARVWQANFTEWRWNRVVFEGFLNAIYAGFAALLTFMLLSSWHVDKFYTIFACGIMGHMGPEGITLLTEVISNGLRSRAGPPPPKG